MKYFYEVLNLNTAIIKKVINVHNFNELWTIYLYNVNVHLRIYKSSLKTDLVPLSEILPYHKIHILLIICGEKLLLFSIFTIIPWKKVCGYQLLQTSEHSCAKIYQKLLQLQINQWKMQKFFITNNKQYMILLYSCTYVVYRIKLLWQTTLVDFGIYNQST